MEWLPSTQRLSRRLNVLLKEIFACESGLEETFPEFYKYCCDIGKPATASITAIDQILRAPGLYPGQDREHDQRRDTAPVGSLCKPSLERHLHQIPRIS